MFSLGQAVGCGILTSRSASYVHNVSEEVQDFFYVCQLEASQSFCNPNPVSEP